MQSNTLCAQYRRQTMECGGHTVPKSRNGKQQNPEQNNISKGVIKYMNVASAVGARNFVNPRVPSARQHWLLVMMMAGRLRIVGHVNRIFSLCTVHKAHETPLRLKNEIVPSNQNEIDPNCPVPVCFFHAVHTFVLDVSNINKNHLVNETENRREPKSEEKKRNIGELKWLGSAQWKNGMQKRTKNRRTTNSDGGEKKRTV